MTHKLATCQNNRHFAKKKIKSVIVSQNHSLNKILDFHPLRIGLRAADTNSVPTGSTRPRSNIGFLELLWAVYLFYNITDIFVVFVSPIQVPLQGCEPVLPSNPVSSPVLSFLNLSVIFPPYVPDLFSNIWFGRAFPRSQRQDYTVIRTYYRSSSNLWR